MELTILFGSFGDGGGGGGGCDVNFFLCHSFVNPFLTTTVSTSSPSLASSLGKRFKKFVNFESLKCHFLDFEDILTEF